MSRHLSIVANLIIVLQVFLLIFCFVDLSILPAFVLYFGKFHPLLLHLPVAMVILLAPLSLINGINEQDSKIAIVFRTALIYTALLSTLTAIGGLLLAAGEDYDPQTLFLHKWFGVGVAFASHALIYINDFSRSKKLVWNVSLLATIVVMITGSHYGGTLTHGEDFLAFSYDKDKAVVAVDFTETTTVYDGAIQPIIEAKCISCHNDKKAKGGLKMTALNAILNGGKSGNTWVAGDPDKSLIIERMLLDMDDKEHMPPRGKTQLTSNEIMLFKEWIRAGAKPEITYHGLSDADTLKKIVAAFIETSSMKKEAKVYTFSPASRSDIEKLNTPFRRIIPVAANSPALVVKFYLKEKFDLNMLKEIQGISKQVVEINLSTMPVDDKVFDLLSPFVNLEILNLNGTDIAGKNLKNLSSNNKLEQLSIANTKVPTSALEELGKNPSLKKVFLWNAKVSKDDFEDIKKKYASITWDLGYIPDKSEILKLSVPYPTDKEKLILDKGEEIVLKHPMPGVKIRYTTDGSLPDSLNGKIYDGPILANGLLRIKAVAVAEGWITSNLTDLTFYQKGISSDSAKLLNNPTRTGPAGAKMLIDMKKGLTQSGDQLYTNWIGFLDNPFKAAIYLGKNPEIKQITLSTAEMTGSYVFPPTKITIKGGSDPKNLKIIGTLSPAMPTAHKPNNSIPYDVPITPGNYAYIEIEAQNLQKLPQWHEGKGQKAWVFVDEIFIY